MQKKFKQLKYIMQFFPLRLNFFVFLFLIIIIYQFATQSSVETSSFQHFLVLMSKIGFLILSVAFILSLFSAVAACLYFIRHRHYFSVQIIKKENEDEHNIHVQANIEKIVRPLLGTISVRYQYNEEQMSPKFVLYNQHRFAFLPAVSHESHIDLPNVKEYNLEAALLSFQDLFRFFSFTFKNKIQSQFINLPYQVDTNEKIVQPRTTQIDEVRTNKLRKISGEWLEYKKYEPTDDVRRIVWKVFAKSKELIIRQQEVLSPYASHIDCYVSFYNNYSLATVCMDAMSDYYKNVVWSFFKELTTHDLQVKLHFDQYKLNVADDELIAEQIAQADWQADLSPASFCDPKKASVIFLHSLIPSDEMEKVLNLCSKSTLVMYVDLIAVFDASISMRWWQRIFLKSRNETEEKAYNNWFFSPNRSAVLKNMGRHKELLNHSLAQTEIIS